MDLLTEFPPCPNWLGNTHSVQIKSKTPFSGATVLKDWTWVFTYISIHICSYSYRMRYVSMAFVFTHGKSKVQEYKCAQGFNPSSRRNKDPGGWDSKAVALSCMSNSGSIVCLQSRSSSLNLCEKRVWGPPGRLSCCIATLCLSVVTGDRLLKFFKAKSLKIARDMTDKLGVW